MAGRGLAGLREGARSQLRSAAASGLCGRPPHLSWSIISTEQVRAPRAAASSALSVDICGRANERGPEGLKDSGSKGHPPRLSAEQLAQLAEVVETGPERAVHGVVRWRRVDLQQIVAERFGVAYHERTIGKILKQLGFSHVSARPRHPAKDEETVAAFKNVWPAPSASSFCE